jgi:formylglycine-generating enzyme required for sulfatase activity
MHGNLAEWCEDGKRVYKSQAETDPRGADASRVIRGGSYSDVSRHCRVAIRYDIGPSFRYYGFGFRVVVR